MTTLHRLAPVLLSSLFLFTSLDTYAADTYAAESGSPSLDPGSEMFDDSADIGGAFDEPTALTKKSMGPSSKANAPTKHKKLAKAKKKHKLHAANKGRKAHKGQQSKKKSHKGKAKASESSTAAM